MKEEYKFYHALRQDIHRHPELGNQEQETTQRIQNFMTAHGIPFFPHPGLTGGYAVLNAGREKTVCMRADIDALPLIERTGAPFASQNEGCMHACGHDMHTSIAAGVACELNKHLDTLPCNVVILFQPAEECNPVGGAKPVIATGLLDHMHIQEVYGLHLWPSLPLGEIALRPGPIMAASDRFTIKIFGRASHAAEPHLGVDAIFVGTEIYCALVHRLRREIDPFSVAVVSIGSFHSSGRYNVVCGEATLEGTIRTTEEPVRRFVHQRIRDMAQSIAASYGAQIQMDIGEGYAVLQNDRQLFSRFAQYAAGVLGEEHVHTHINPSLIGEDFAYYSQQRPSLYFFLGCQSEYPLHSDHFLPREEALDVGVDLMSRYFLTYPGK